MNRRCKQESNTVSFAEKDAPLRPVLEEIAIAHPEYGVPRTVVELRETCGLRINHKMVRRLRRLWDLALLRATRTPKLSPFRQVIDLAGDRANLVARLEAIEPFAVTYTDFTEIPYAKGYRVARHDCASGAGPGLRLLCLDQLAQIVAEWVDHYNRSRRHSSLAYQTPLASMRKLRPKGPGVAVDSVDSPDGIAHLAYGPATTAAHRRRAAEARRSRS